MYNILFFAFWSALHTRFVAVFVSLEYYEIGWCGRRWLNRCGTRKCITLIHVHPFIHNAFGCPQISQRRMDIDK